MDCSPSPTKPLYKLESLCYINRMTNDFDLAGELEWIYGMMESDPKIYMPEDVIGGGVKDYCMDDVHRFGRSEAGRAWYGKLKDLVKVRLTRLVEGEKIDRGMVLELLRPYGTIDSNADSGMILTDTDRALLKRAGVLYDE